MVFCDSFAMEMMMSERPAQISNTETVPIGNYKGVMLCSRPYVNESSDKKPKNEKPPFLSAVCTKDVVGLNPVKRIQVTKPRESKKTVLSKHKKWLHEIQMKNEEERCKCEEEEVKAQERRKKVSLWIYQKA